MDHGAKNKALVIGGGPAGMGAALVLAERGHKVVLADSAPAAGGLFPLLDNQFPTQSCGVCFMACKTPTYCPFVQCELNGNIEFLPNACASAAEGAKGDFSVTFDIAPTSVSSEKCTDCGACEKVCPVETAWEFGDGLEKRKAIYRCYPKSVGKGYAVDRANCTRCGECLKVCAPGAIDLGMAGTTAKVNAAAVVLAPGQSTIKGGLKGEYGYGRYENVLTAVKFERMLAAGSPSSGKPVRISDGAAPSSIAFIQCAGSRDRASGRPNCSSVCCMFTLKQALFAAERLPETKITVYYMDLRAFGKDYENYIREAEKNGIEFVRAMPSVLRLDPATADLLVETPRGGKDTAQTRHSMVVLATGFECGPDAQKTAALFGLDAGPQGLAGLDEFDPAGTMKPGVYAAGNFRGVKDIPEAVADGAAAAALAATCLETESETALPFYPAPADFLDEEPKIGVVLCDCEGYSSGLVDFGTLSEKVGKMPGVAFVEKVSHACSKAGSAGVRAIFGLKEPTRLVLAACAERVVGELYGHMFREMGVHPSVLAFSDLRQAARTGDLDAAKGSVAAEIARTTVESFAAPARASIHDNVLVVGGGAAGMAAALTLADLGHTVHLIEKSSSLGGNLSTARYTVKGGDPVGWLEKTRKLVEANPLVTIHRNTRIAESSGRIGNFITKIETPNGPVEIIHGAALLATGAREARPAIHGYGGSPRVLTQKELEGKIASREFPGGRVVMLQCAGSREEAEGARPYCSRVCCTHAIKNSRELLKLAPASEVTVLYRDLRAYGSFETAYEAARLEGVLFTSFGLDKRPEIKAGENGVEVTYTEPSTGDARKMEADWLVLSTGMEPDREESARLAAIFGVEVDANGFFTEKSAKAATTDFVKPGIYMAGLAHGPKHAEEAIVQARAAAGRLSAVLSAKTLETPANPSYVVDAICSRCGVCVEACPYGARSLDFEANAALVDAILCRACGACTTACPNKAARQYHTAPSQLLAVIDELL